MKTLVLFLTFISFSTAYAETTPVFRCISEMCAKMNEQQRAALNQLINQRMSQLSAEEIKLALEINKGQIAADSISVIEDSEEIQSQLSRIFSDMDSTSSRIESSIEAGDVYNFSFATSRKRNTFVVAKAYLEDSKGPIVNPEGPRVVKNTIGIGYKPEQNLMVEVAVIRYPSTEENIQINGKLLKPSGLIFSFTRRF